MLNFFKEYKKQLITLLAVILGVSAIVVVGKKTNSSFVNNTLGLVIAPLQSITTNITGWFDDRITYLRDETDIYEENKELQAKIELLESENKRLSLYEEENEKLSKLLEIAQKYPAYTTFGATIIGKDPGNWYDIFVIDKGTADGLEVNMVIMDEGGIVGKINEVGYNYSKVQSILDSHSSVAAMSLRTGDLGVVRGDYTLLSDGLCRMDYIDADSEIMNGDEIVTSSLSDIYPSGLTIGYVKEIIANTNGLTKYAIIEPQVDFKRLSTILVLNDTPVSLKNQEE